MFTFTMAMAEENSLVHLPFKMAVIAMVKVNNAHALYFVDLELYDL